VNPIFSSDSRYPKIRLRTRNFESGLKDDDGLKDKVVPGVHPSILIKSLHPDSVSHPAAIRLAQALQR